MYDAHRYTVQVEFGLAWRELELERAPDKRKPTEANHTESDVDGCCWPRLMLPKPEGHTSTGVGMSATSSGVKVTEVGHGGLGARSDK